MGMERIKYIWHLLWRGRWKPVEIIFLIVGIYDTTISQGFPNSDAPTLSDWLPKWQWQGWVILILLIIIIAMAEGSYRIHKEREKTNSGKEQSSYAIAWVNEPQQFSLRTPNGFHNYWDNEKGALSLLLKGHISVTTIGTIQVESVNIDIGGKQFTSNWQSENFYTSEERDADFDIPLNEQHGKRTAKLKAIVDGKSYNSEPFILDFPQGKQVFHKGDSQP